MRCLLLPVLLLTYYGQVFGQAPSGHAEVWQYVEKYWGLWAERDLDGFLECHHVAYSGWDYDNPMHRGKLSAREWYEQEFKTRTVTTFDISPIDIKIHDDTAVIHYYFSILEQRAKEDEIKRSGRITDVLIKQSNKWVLIARHGGDTH